jgi:hypothetical protein
MAVTSVRQRGQASNASPTAVGMATLVGPKPARPQALAQASSFLGSFAQFRGPFCLI